jgi:hypothetical protein
MPATLKVKVRRRTNLSLKTTRRGKLTIKTNSRFPARVLGTDGITITQAGGVFTFSIDTSGTSIVTGPVTVTDHALARWDTTTGNLLQNSTVTLSDAGVVAGFSFDLTTNTLSGTTAQFNAALSDNDFATWAGAEALTNKTYNGLTITPTTGTLTIADGKTLTLSNTLTFTGTDGSSVAFGTGGTVLYASNIGTSVQGWDADLDALAALASTGIAVRTALNTWAQRTLAAPAAGVTVSNGDGVSGNPTLALANDLAALEGLSSTGFAARTTTDTWAQRTLTAPAAGLTITNPAGIAGDPTFALADDLAALEGMSGTGLVARTASNTYAQRTLTAPAAGITVSNGDGVSGNPTLALADDLAALEALSGTNTIYYRSASNTWTAVTMGTGITFSGGALTGCPRGHLWGLTLSNNVTDATNDIDIAAGEATSTEATPALMVLASALTKRLDASWAVGTGNGGLDTGSIADTTYHVWLIRRSDTGVVDALFSTSATSPTMPTNYDQKRRIGSIVRLSSAIKGFVQDGDDFKWKSMVQDVSVTNPGTSAVTRTLTLPVGIRVRASLNVGFGATTAADNPASVYVSDLSVTDNAANIGNLNIIIYSASAVISNAAAFAEVMTNTSAQVRSRIQTSTAGSFFYIWTTGWRDARGRFE